MQHVVCPPFYSTSPILSLISSETYCPSIASVTFYRHFTFQYPLIKLPFSISRRRLLLRLLFACLAKTLTHYFLLALLLRLFFETLLRTDCKYFMIDCLAPTIQYTLTISRPTCYGFQYDSIEIYLICYIIVKVIKYQYNCIYADSFWVVHVYVADLFICSQTGRHSVLQITDNKVVSN